MTLTKHTLYNLLSSVIIRGSTLLVLGLTFSLLESEAYFNLTRLILLMEVISGFSNIISKHAIMRRKFLFRNEIAVLLYVQILLVAVVFLIFNQFDDYLSRHFDLSSDLLIYAACLSVAINISYIFESVLRKENLYKELARLYLIINGLSLTVFFIVGFYSTELSPYVFFTVQKNGLFVITGSYILIHGLLSPSKKNGKIFALYHGKYSLHTIFEGMSVAVYRPGMQLVLAPFISVQQASLLFWVLRLLEGVVYQLPLNLSQVFYTNYRASSKYQLQAWNYIFLYQSLILASAWLWHNFYPTYLSDSAQLMLLGFTVLPYMLLLNSQNRLMYNKKVSLNILLTIVTRCIAIIVLYTVTRLYGMAGYVFGYTASVFISSLVFLYFTQRSIPNILFICFFVFIGAVFFV